MSATNLPKPKEINESRRQALLQKYADGIRLTDEQLESIKDLIEDKKKKKPSKKDPKRAEEATMTSAELYRATGHGQSAIAEMKATGVIAPAGENKWPILATLGAMYRRLRERNAGEMDRQRKNKFEADQAELDALDAAKKLCSIADAKLFWSDARIEVKQTIERASYLTPVQKTKLLTELAALKPKLETDK